MARYIVANPISLEPEVDLLLRRVHILLEILFPDLCPRPAEHVGHRELDGLSRRDLRRLAVDRIQRARALRPAQPVRLAPTLLIVTMPENAHRLPQRFAVVDDRLPIDAEELAARVAHRREYLD